MFPLSRMNIQTLFVVFLLSLVCGQDRKINSKLNPGCNFCTDKDTLIYIQAEGPHDTVHQIWDFTSGIPTIIFAIAGVNSSINIVWDLTEPKTYWFSELPRYSFALAIDKLIEYSDIDDKGHLDPKDPSFGRSLEFVTWHRNVSKLTDQEVMVNMQGQFMNKQKFQADTIEIKLDLLPFQDYAVDLPHLIHTSNSTLVDVSLVNLTSPGVKAARFALHVVLVATDSSTETMSCAVRKSLDDEHTPGVFEIFEIKTPETNQNGDGGFIQFRPVAYTKPERGVTSSTVTHVSDLNHISIGDRIALSRFYNLFKEILSEDMFISFGESGDGYYKQHNYTAWSFTMGYGQPPVENFSLFVILVISIGLGVPVMLALSGIVYVVTRRCKQRNTPQRFIDNDE